MQLPEIQRLVDILSSFLGQPKNEVSDNYQVQFSCPRCIEQKGEGERNKHNLEVNLAKGVFKCWSCASEGEEMQGTVKKLIKRYGNSKILEEYQEIMNEILSLHLYELIDFKEGYKEYNEERLRLPQSFKYIEDIEKCNWKIKNYLLKRGITNDIILKYKIGYTTWDDPEWSVRNRIIIPSFNRYGELNYWVGRTYNLSPPKEKEIFKEDNNKKKFEVSKYKNCKINKDSIIFQESHICFDEPIVLVEGAIDCLYYPNAISLLGKVLSPDSEINKQLKNKANAPIYICLDSDTKLREIKRIYTLLDNGRLKGKIYYIRLGNNNIPYKDFGEIYENEGKRGIIKALKSAKKFSETELLW